MPKETPPFIAPTDNYWSSIKEFSWRLGNLTTVIAATSAAVAVVYNPLTVLMVNQRLIGKFVPASVVDAGLYAVAGALLRGAGTTLAGSSVRSAYTAGITSSRRTGHGAEETIIEEGAHQASSELRKVGKGLSTGFFAGLANIGISALGEVIIKQPFDMKAQLERFQINTDNFKWRSAHNAYKLCTTGMGSQLGSSLIGFYSFYVVEPYLSSLMSGDDHPSKHFVTGAASGMISAVLSFPFSYYRDTIFKDTTVAAGQLSTPSFRSVSTQARSYVHEAGIKKAVKDMAKICEIQIPLKMVRTAGVFSMVCGIGSTLGKTPLDDLTSHSFRFFRQTKDISKRDLNVTSDERTELQNPFR